MNTVKIILMISTVLLVTAGTALPAETLNFSGYTWVVRPAGTGGPGPNHWYPENVSVDTNGYLHLRLTQREGKWYSSEVFTQNRFGFGRYEFQLGGPVDRLDPNVVLGLFNYPTRDVGRDGTHEIDIEFAQWGNATAPHGNFTVWPATNSLRQATKSFTFALDGDSSTHSFTWSPTNVVFESHRRAAEPAHRIASWLYQPTNAAAAISQKPMPVHMNLWCFKGEPPKDGKQVELIVRAFKFTPL